MSKTNQLSKVKSFKTFFYLRLIIPPFPFKTVQFTNKFEDKNYENLVFVAEHCTTPINNPPASKVSREEANLTERG